MIISSCSPSWPTWRPPCCPVLTLTRQSPAALEAPWSPSSAPETSPAPSPPGWWPVGSGWWWAAETLAVWPGVCFLPGWSCWRRGRRWRGRRRWCSPPSTQSTITPWWGWGSRWRARCWWTSATPPDWTEEGGPTPRGWPSCSLRAGWWRASTRCLRGRCRLEPMMEADRWGGGEEQNRIFNVSSTPGNTLWYVVLGKLASKIPNWAIRSGNVPLLLLQVLICSDCSDSKSTVLQLARRLGFSPVDLGGLCASRDIEEAPLILFPSWGGPVLTTFLLFLFFYGYLFLRNILLPYLDEGRNNFYELPLVTVNQALPAVSLVTLALVYLPGDDLMIRHID